MVCTSKLCICVISRVFFSFLSSLFRFFCMQILSPPLTFILSYTFLLWTHSFFSHHYARLYSITPIGSLTRTFLLPSAFFIFFNAQWHSRVFIAAGECPGRCNFNSIVSCIRGMIYAMHSRSCVHAHSATGHEEDRRCALALSGLCRRRVRYLNGVVPFSFFLSFFFHLLRFREYDGSGKTIYWLEIEKRIQFRRESRFIFSPIHILWKIDCTFAFIYFYSRAEISNSTDKRNPFSISFIEVKSRWYARRSDSG